MVMLKFLPKDDFELLIEDLEVFDVDGSELIPMALPEWKLYSKFRSVYLEFKGNHLTWMGIFVQYSAVRKGKALMGYKHWEGMGRHKISIEVVCCFIPVSIGNHMISSEIWEESARVNFSKTNKITRARRASAICSL